jgi:Uma2 family endonuclease
MATVLEPTLITVDEFLALPDDGKERWLINGVVHEFERENPGVDMTVRNWLHSVVLSNFVQQLRNWVDLQPFPRGTVVSGEAGFRLEDSPTAIVGIDVAYISPRLTSQLSSSSALIEGVPELAVEILSPHDTQEKVNKKIGIYQSAGVPLVWIVDPELKTIVVHAQGKAPVMFNREQTITAEPYLPGFSAAVEKLLAV